MCWTRILIFVTVLFVKFVMICFDAKNALKMNIVAISFQYFLIFN